MTKETKRLTFEQALEMLEECSQTLSREGVDLDEAMKAYEEGIKYYGICNRILDEAVQKIEIFGDEAREDGD